MSTRSPRSPRSNRRRPVVAPALAAAVLGVAVLAYVPEASAYRPFISTDAAVADPKEVEIEIGYFTLQRENHENSFIIPRTVFNYGLFRNWEAVAEFAVRRDPQGHLDIIDPGLFIKGVLKEGVLQEKPGVSVAVEAGPLLPSTERGQRHVGFEGTAIVSGRLGPVTVHLNGGVGVERSNGDVVGIWGVIGELPVAKGLRVVGEVAGEKAQREDQEHSALLGVIWQPWESKNVWFDAGIRRGLTSGVPDWQATLGVTFGFSVSSLARGASSLDDLHRLRTDLSRTTHGD